MSRIAVSEQVIKPYGAGSVKIAAREQVNLNELKSLRIRLVS